MGKHKGKKKGLDDLTAVRTVVGALRRFDDDVRDRILRWAQEKLDDLKSKSKAKAKFKSKPAGKKKGKKKKGKKQAKPKKTKTSR